MTVFKEQFRLTLSQAGKTRNRAEAHLIKYAQQLLAKPVAIKIGHIQEELRQVQEVVEQDHPSWGTCRVSDIQIATRGMGESHLVTRSIAIYGRGRSTYSLLISETVSKNNSNGCSPVVPYNSIPI